MTCRNRKLAAKLCKLSYQEIDRALSSRSDDALIDLLDSRSTKVGDSAASLLSRRGKVDLVIDAVFSKRITTQTGKIRAHSIVSRRGRAVRRAASFYLFLLNDRSEGVVEWAMFGLAFLQDKRYLEEIRQVQECWKPGTEVHKEAAKAIAALEKEDPFIYSPSFHDAGDVWKLDKKRFADRIG